MPHTPNHTTTFIWAFRRIQLHSFAVYKFHIENGHKFTKKIVFYAYDVDLIQWVFFSHNMLHQLRCCSHFPKNSSDCFGMVPIFPQNSFFGELNLQPNS